MVTPQQSHLVKYGHSSIFVHNDDFEDGYSNGLLSPFSDAHHPLTDITLYECIVQNLFEKSASQEWNTGYLLGMVINLLLGKRESIPPNAPCVPLGAVTLRLNNWRFRDAFYVGQEDYHIMQSEQGPRNVITAGDLLRFLAHYDPETKRYSLAEDDVNMPEDMLGRFTRFLCETLFAQDTRQDTANRCIKWSCKRCRRELLL